MQMAKLSTTARTSALEPIDEGASAQYENELINRKSVYSDKILIGLLFV